MKIGFVTPVNGISGGLFVVYRHAQYLASRGHDVQILVVSEVTGTQIQGFPGTPPRMISLREAVEGRHRFDAVISTWWETYYEMFALDADNYFYFCQSDERRFYEPKLNSPRVFIEQTYRDRGVGVITEARWIQRWLKEEFGLEAEYAPNGVDTRMFHPDVTPLAARGEKPRILIEGPGAQAFKRVAQAFEVMDGIAGVEVWLVSGDGVVDPAWKADRTFQHVPHEKMPEIYASCDFLLKLSTVEGFFGPPLEMMACGGTAVVARATGWDEYVRHDENALVVEIDDVKGAREAVQNLVNDHAHRKRLSLEGLRTARAMDWSSRTPLFEAALQSLVNKNLRTELAHQYVIQNRLRKSTENHELRIANLEDQLFNWRPFQLWKKTRAKIRRQP